MQPHRRLAVEVSSNSLFRDMCELQQTASTLTVRNFGIPTRGIALRGNGTQLSMFNSDNFRLCPNFPIIASILFVIFK